MKDAPGHHCSVLMWVNPLSVLGWILRNLTSAVQGIGMHLFFRITWQNGLKSTQYRYTVADCLVALIWRHEVPSRIIYDRAPEFLSDVLQDTAAIFGLQQLLTSGGHPQTDGRRNRTLKAMLTNLVSKKGKDWDTKLGPVLMAYRTTLQTPTGEPPFYYCMGKMPKYHLH